MSKVNDLMTTLRTKKIFLWLEQEELRFRAPLHAMTQELRSEIIACKNELKEFIRQSVAEHATQLAPIPTLAPAAYYALSQGQQRLMILDQLEWNLTTHNMFTGHRILGSLNVDQLNRAFQKVIDRHEILRTGFVEVETEYVQHIVDSKEFNTPITYVDLTAERDGMQIIYTRAKEELVNRFNLSSPPLFRATLFKMKEDDHIFFLTLHHIISDGWSQEVLLHNVLQYYTGNDATLKPLRIQYKEYASWMNNIMNGTEVEAYEAYWLSLFQTPPPLLPLPYDFPRSEVKQHLGMSHSFLIQGKLVEDIRAICREHNITLFTFFFAIFKTILYRYTGVRDITVGTPIAGRPHPDLEDQIGFYVNTLAFRTEIQNDTTFEGLMRSIIKQSEVAFRYQLYPFNNLVERLQLKRDLSRHPLFDTLYTFENAKDRKPRMQLEGLKLEAVPLGHCSDKFDLEFTVIDETEDTLECYLNFNANLFKKETIEQLGRHIESVSVSAVDQPYLPLRELQFISTTEALVAEENKEDMEDLFDFDN